MKVAGGIIVAAMWATSSAALADEDWTTGWRFYQECKAHEDWCPAYLLGFADAIVAAPAFCLPPNVTAGQMRLSFLRYAEQHPAELSLPRGTLARAALIQSFKCSQEEAGRRAAANDRADAIARDLLTTYKPAQQ